MARQITKSDIEGGSGGEAWDDEILSHSPTIVGIESLNIWHGDQVDGLQVTYRLANGDTFEASHHGGTGGSKSSATLAKDEAIVEMSGKTNGMLLDQVSFLVKNASGQSRQLGPFGRTGGTPFAIPGYIVGFFGRSGSLMDGLGAYYLPPLTKLPIVGGTGGSVFSDPVETNPVTNVKQIQIRSGNQLDGMEVNYLLLGGGILQGSRHGGTGGIKQTVDLVDGEFIVNVTGKTNGQFVDQITIITHRPDGTEGVYGPFGKTGSNEFSLGGNVVGFYGRAGSLIDALGVIRV